MLVLTRKVLERLYIGSEICVTVVRLEGNQVRLGIEAPRHVPVVREELLPEQSQSHSAKHAVQDHPPVSVARRVTAAPAGRREPAIIPRGIGIRRRGPSR